MYRLQEAVYKDSNFNRALYLKKEFLVFRETVSTSSIAYVSMVAVKITSIIWTSNNHHHIVVITRNHMITHMRCKFAI